MMIMPGRVHRCFAPSAATATAARPGWVLTCGGDPLHLAAVFGIDDTTAIRYATIARQLLEAPAEQHAPGRHP